MRLSFKQLCPGNQQVGRGLNVDGTYIESIREVVKGSRCTAGGMQKGISLHLKEESLIVGKLKLSRSKNINGGLRF